MRAYIDGNDTWRSININGCIRKEMDIVVLTGSKLKEHLFLPNLGEVELVLIEGLKDLINTKLSRPLLEMPALVQLSDETILPRNHLPPISSNSVSYN